MNQAENNTQSQVEPKKLSVIDISKRARQRLRSRQFTAARTLFSEGLAVEPENPYLLSGMGDACREIGDYKEAERCYSSLLEIDGDNLFALRGLGDVYKKMSRHREALQLWDRYLALRPQDKFVMTRLADSCKALNLFDRATTAYQQILAVAATDRFALSGLADLLHRQGKEQEAIDTYEKILQLDPNEIHILTIIGKLCWRVSDFGRAEEYFKRALQVEPKNTYALFGLGNCYRWQRQYADALVPWEKILLISAGTQALHTRMGDAYCHLYQLDEAEVSYKKSLEFGDDLFATAGLICLSCERKKWNFAAECFAKLIAASTDIADEIDILVKRFIRLGKREAMIEFFSYLLAHPAENQSVDDEIRKQLAQLTL